VRFLLLVGLVELGARARQAPRSPPEGTTPGPHLDVGQDRYSLVLLVVRTGVAPAHRRLAPASTCSPSVPGWPPSKASNGRVTVAEQVSEVNGQLIPGPPKTEAGRRTVTLPAVAAVALAEHLAEYAEPGPDGLVFPAPRVAIGGAPTSAAAGGSEQPARPAWKGRGSTIFATRPPPSPWRRAATPES
jgi:hypothetical protein